MVLEARKSALGHRYHSEFGPISCRRDAYWKSQLSGAGDRSVDYRQRYDHCRSGCALLPDQTRNQGLPRKLASLPNAKNYAGNTDVSGEKEDLTESYILPMAHHMPVAELLQRGLMTIL